MLGLGALLSRPTWRGAISMSAMNEWTIRVICALYGLNLFRSIKAAEDSYSAATMHSYFIIYYVLSLSLAIFVITVEVFIVWILQHCRGCNLLKCIVLFILVLLLLSYFFLLFIIYFICSCIYYIYVYICTRVVLITVFVDYTDTEWNRWFKQPTPIMRRLWEAD